MLGFSFRESLSAWSSIPKLWSFKSWGQPGEREQDPRLKVMDPAKNLESSSLASASIPFFLPGPAITLTLHGPGKYGWLPEILGKMTQSYPC